jgi:hypothetical protein
MAVILVGEDPGVPISHNNKLISIKNSIKNNFNRHVQAARALYTSTRKGKSGG